MEKREPLVEDFTCKIHEEVIFYNSEQSKIEGILLFHHHD